MSSGIYKKGPTSAQKQKRGKHRGSKQDSIVIADLDTSSCFLGLVENIVTGKALTVRDVHTNKLVHCSTGKLNAVKNFHKEQPVIFAFLGENKGEIVAFYSIDQKEILLNHFKKNNDSKYIINQRDHEFDDIIGNSNDNNDDDWLKTEDDKPIEINNSEKKIEIEIEETSFDSSKIKRTSSVSSSNQDTTTPKKNFNNYIDLDDIISDSDIQSDIDNSIDIVEHHDQLNHEKKDDQQDNKQDDQQDDDKEEDDNDDDDDDDDDMNPNKKYNRRQNKKNLKNKRQNDRNNKLNSRVIF